MTEPGADRVDVDTRAQEVDGRRVPDHVRADALGGDRRDALRRSGRDAAREGRAA